MIRTLFVDDEPMIREQAEIFLKQAEEDIDLELCSSADEVLKKLDDSHHDIVVSDYRMPGMDGISLLKKIRDRGDDIPFIILTGEGSEEVAMEALNNGADRYLIKGGNTKVKYEILARAIFDEVERAETKAKLKELNEIKEDFISATAHELRTPLVPIKTYSEYMKEEKLGEVTEEQREKLDQINNAVDRLSKTIQEMLDVSRLSIGETIYDMEEVALDEIVEEAVDQVKVLASDKDIDLLNKVSNEHPVFGDRDFLVVALKNLLENAIKYSNDDSKVKILSSRKEDIIQLCVEDRGVGIPDEDIDDIFKEYYIAGSDLKRENSKGIGLGLYLVKKIVKDHGGDIGVRSQEGKGSRFYINLPMESDQ